MQSLRLIAPLALFSLAALQPVHAQCPASDLELAPFDGAPSDFYGDAVALSGELAVVGSPFDDDACPSSPICQSGTVYIYERDGDDWPLAQKLTHEDGGSLDFYGTSVALSGDRLAVGAAGDGSAGFITGAVYVYERIDGEFLLDQLVLPSDPAPQHGFGLSVAISGDTLLVGAWADGDQGPSAGAAYFYERDTNGWVQTQKVIAFDSGDFDYFGESVALDGDRAVIGAWGDNEPHNDTGAAFIFDRGANGWQQAAKLVASDAGLWDQFGRAVAVHGDRVLIGSYWDDNLGFNVGAAYVFELDDGAWFQIQRLSPPFPAQGEMHFGRAVALDDSRALVGAPRDNDGGFAAGAVFAYRATKSGYELDHKHLALGAENDQLFGRSLAVANGRALVGTPGVGSLVFSGTAHMIDPAVASAVSFCACNTAAPCGNGDPGAGCTNSSGAGARIASCGSARVSTDDLVLTASALPLQQWGVLFMGGAEIELPMGDGLRCVGSGGAGLYRFPVQNSGAGGALTIGPGLVASSEALFGAGGHLSPGSSWRFQAWFRDPAGPCGSGFNFSDAVLVSFEP